MSPKTQAQVAAPVEPARAESPLEGIVGYKLKRAQIRTFQELIERFGELDLRPAQFSLLRVLEAMPGLSQTEAAATLEISNANFVSLVDQFAARGLARREVSRTDRRERKLYLTPQGRALARRAESIFTAYEAELAERLGGPEERDRFLDMLARIIGERPRSG